jgi:hypothetical protein
LLLACYFCGWFIKRLPVLAQKKEFARDGVKRCVFVAGPCIKKKRARGAENMNRLELPKDIGEKVLAMLQPKPGQSVC